jgi:hypothetical protein
MTCPLLRKDKLDGFLAAYDPELVGFGCDWFLLETLGEDLRGKVAVIDAITCVNPHDASKGGREIDRLMPVEERHANWVRIRERHGIRSEARGIVVYGPVPRTGVSRILAWMIAGVGRSWAKGSELVR